MMCIGLLGVRIGGQRELTYHTSNDDNGGKVLKFGHIPPDLLVDGIKQVTDPSQERKYQQNLWYLHTCTDI